MTPTNEQIRTAIAQQAAVWFLAHRAGPLSERERQEFMAWLRLSPLNIAEYLAVAGIARDLPAAAAGLPLPDLASTSVAASAPLESAGQVKARGWRRGPSPLRLAGAGLALMAVLATAYAVLGGAWQPFLSTDEYRTGHGEQNSWTLADGSVLRLNTDSQVKVRLSRGERVIELDRGQIFLQVAHDTQRRLRVQAGDANVVATGTQFDVYRFHEGVTLTVLEGQVAVFAGNAPADNAGGVVVHANESSRIDSGSVSQPTAVDGRAAEAWLSHQIIFRERPLGEIAAEFSRYAPLPIEVRDAKLGELAISGDFDAFDSESFLAFLRANSDVVIRREPDRIVVSAR
jgi:transmembrane sensor